MRLDTLTVLNTLAAFSHDGTLISLVLTLKPTTATSRRSREHFKSALKALRIPMLVKVEAQWLESGHLHYHAHITLPSTPETAKLLTALGIAPKTSGCSVSGRVTYAYRELVKRVLAHTVGKPKCQPLQPLGGSWSAWAKYMRKDTVLPGLTNLWHFNISKPRGQKPASERHKTHENKLQLLGPERGEALSDTQKLPPATPVPSNPKTQISDGKNRPQFLLLSYSLPILLSGLPKLNPPLNSPGGAVNRPLSNSGLKQYYPHQGRVHTLRGVQVSERAWNTFGRVFRDYAAKLTGIARLIIVVSWVRVPPPPPGGPPIRGGLSFCHLYRPTPKGVPSGVMCTFRPAIVCTLPPNRVCAKGGWSMFRLEDLVAEFLRDCHARHLSRNTLSYYEASLRQFVAFLRAEGLPLDVQALTPMVLRRFAEVSESQGLGPGGVHARLRAIRAFCGFLVQEELLERNPFKRFKLPKLPQEQLPVVSSAEFTLLMQVAATTRHPLRDQAILSLLYDTGLRARELLGLTLEDVGVGVLLVRGKGAKERYVPVSKLTMRRVRVYLRSERPVSPLPQVFLADKETPLNYSGLRGLLQRLYQRAGLPYKSPHAFRRGMAVEFLRNGGDVFTLQRILGHATLEMTRRYAQLSLEDVRTVFAKASPVANATRRMGK